MVDRIVHVYFLVLGYGESENQHQDATHDVSLEETEVVFDGVDLGQGEEYLAEDCVGVGQAVVFFYVNVFEHFSKFFCKLLLLFY